MTANELKLAADTLEKVLAGLNSDYYKFTIHKGYELVDLMRNMADKIIDSLTKQASC